MLRMSLYCSRVSTRRGRLSVMRSAFTVSLFLNRQYALITCHFLNASKQLYDNLDGSCSAYRRSRIFPVFSHTRLPLKFAHFWWTWTNRLVQLPSKDARLPDFTCFLRLHQCRAWSIRLSAWACWKKYPGSLWCCAFPEARWVIGYGSAFGLLYDICEEQCGCYPSLWRVLLLEVALCTAGISVKLGRQYDGTGSEAWEQRRRSEKLLYFCLKIINLIEWRISSSPEF